MKWKRKSILAVLALLIAGTRVFAQTIPCTPQQQSVYLNILRPSSASPDLAASVLSAKLDKERVEVLSILPADFPHRAIILLDSSGSVLSNPAAWRTYLAIAKNLLTTLPAGATASVAVFADRIDVLIPGTNDRTKLDDQFKALDSGWGYFRRPRSSALWDTMKAAADMFGEPANGDVLYVLSDGDDNASRIPLSEVEAIIRSKTIQLQLISVAPHRTKTEAWQKLQKLVASTDGSTTEIFGKLDSPALLQAVPRPYRMELKVPQELKHPENSLVALIGTTVEGADVQYFGHSASCSDTKASNQAH